MFGIVSRTELTLNLSIYLKEPLDKMYVHSMFYYRFNGIEYKKFPIDIWEDICQWLAKRHDAAWMKKSKYFFMEWTVGKLLNYTNWNHTCPYEGEIFARTSRISVDSFNIPQIFPSGNFALMFCFSKVIANLLS